MTSADNGTHSFAVEFKTPSVQTLTVNLIGGGGGANSYVVTSPAITVTPGAAAAFRVTGLANAVAGTAQSFAVAAIDSVGNVVPNYVGTVAFGSTDVQAGLPASYTFTAADTGAHAFTATLKTAGSQSVSVSDASHTLSGTEAGITITPAAMTRFGIAAPTTAATGKSFSVTVSALDAFGNLVPTYRGKVHFTDTLAAGLPSDYTFNATDNGQHTFSLSLKTAGTQTPGCSGHAEQLDLRRVHDQHHIPNRWRWRRRRNWRWRWRRRRCARRREFINLAPDLEEVIQVSGSSPDDPLTRHHFQPD